VAKQKDAVLGADGEQAKTSVRRRSDQREAGKLGARVQVADARGGVDWHGYRWRRSAGAARSRRATSLQTRGEHALKRWMPETMK
jgi:hypothetical protein